MLTSILFGERRIKLVTLHLKKSVEEQVSSPTK